MTFTDVVYTRLKLAGKFGVQVRRNNSIVDFAEEKLSLKKQCIMPLLLVSISRFFNFLKHRKPLITELAAKLILTVV